MRKYPCPLFFFFRKMLISAFLLRFKANYLEKMCGYPFFSLWIPVALAKIYFFPHGPNLAQKHLYLVGRLVSSVGRAPDCSAGGRGFEPQTRPTLRVLK